MVPKSMAMYSWTYAENDCQEMYNCERERKKKKREKKMNTKEGVRERISCKRKLVCF